MVAPYNFSQDRDRFSAETDKLSNEGSEQAEQLRAAEAKLIVEQKHHVAMIGELEEKLRTAQEENEELRKVWDCG